MRDRRERQRGLPGTDTPDVAAQAGLVDLRSDSVTAPPPGMRAALVRADTGDDAFGDDPSVNRLERRAAVVVGKEAALFVPSDTLANLVALLAHGSGGARVLVGETSWLWRSEAARGDALARLACMPVPSRRGGELDLASLERAARDGQGLDGRLVCLENTHAASGGRLLPAAHVQQVRALATRHAMALHLDGTRLFNAAAASGRTPAKLAAAADSVSFSLSKGLAAPMGALVAGQAEFIARARHWRRVLGGSLHQAGFVAAAGLYALEYMPDRLVEDHSLARLLWQGLRDARELRCDPDPPQTNMVLFELAEGEPRGADLLAALRAAGVLLGRAGDGRLRAVTHYGLDREQIERAVEAVTGAVRNLRQAEAPPPHATPHAGRPSRAPRRPPDRISAALAAL